MQRRYQVFISSTLKDLEPARQEVSKALLRTNCFPAGMELFPAADEEQFEFIKKVIRESDYYVIISAGRYGSISPNTDLSYTEMEYDYAVEIGKPVIRLLHSDPTNNLVGSLLEQSDRGREKLKRFRQKLSSQKLVSFWSDYRELGQLVILGLLEAQRKSPTPGWIRADGNPNSSRISISESEFTSLVQTVVRTYVGDTKDSLKSDNQNQEIFEAVARLAEGISRDLNSLLTEITSNCDILLLRHTSSNTNYKNLVNINQSANRAAALVSQLLAFAQKQELKLRPYDLRQVFLELEHLSRRIAGEGVDISYTFDDLLPLAYIDKRQFEQVALNLILNARDAMSGEGQIRVSAFEKTFKKATRMTTGLLNPGRYVTVVFEDEGIGIAEENLVEIFSPFFSLRGPLDQSGNGLGLSTVQGIVKQFGGEIDVESKNGATFSVYLPRF